MSRRIYISDGVLSLVEYLPEDDEASFENWQDEETKSGYNFVRNDTFEEYSAREIKQRFFASVMQNETETIIGTIGLSPAGSPPDLALWIYKAFRGKGFGAKTFALGIRYCFENLKLEKIYAGCYSHNQASWRMLRKCGFIPHPSGNINEKHYLTGEPLIQHDFVLYNPDRPDMVSRIISGVSADKPLVDICKEAGIDKKEFYKKVYELIDDRQIPNILICFCGHDCSKCKTFQATLNDDVSMLEDVAAFYKAEFNQTIPLEKLYCLSGRSDEVMDGCLQCPFMQCCNGKGISSCKKCADYPCRMLADYEKAYVNKANQI